MRTFNTSNWSNAFCTHKKEKLVSISLVWCFLFNSMPFLYPWISWHFAGGKSYTIWESVIVNDWIKNWILEPSTILFSFITKVSASCCKLLPKNRPIHRSNPKPKRRLQITCQSKFLSQKKSLNKLIFSIFFHVLPTFPKTFHAQQDAAYKSKEIFSSHLLYDLFFFFSPFPNLIFLFIIEIEINSMERVI